MSGQNLPGSSIPPGTAIPVGNSIVVTQSVVVEMYIAPGNSTLQTFQFAEEPKLRNKRILYIDAFNDETMSKSRTGKDLISVDVFKRSFLTMYSMESAGTAIGGERIRWLPLTSLSVLQLPSGTVPYLQNRLLLNNRNTDWSKCYIDTGGQIGEDNVSFVLNVIYTDV